MRLQCVSADAFSSMKGRTIACVLSPSWTAMLLMAVQYKNTYDETLKERANDESNCSLSWQATFHAP